MRFAWPAFVVRELRMCWDFKLEKRPLRTLIADYLHSLFF
jgi:hypothetical protein